jgi:hypothetical protein
MVIRLSAGSADIGGNKGDCNAKFAATPHRRSTVLVKYYTQRIHQKLGGTRKSIRKKFSLNIQAPSITGGSQGVYAEERRNSTLLYIQRWSIIKNSAEDVSDERAIDAFTAGLRCSDLVEEIGRTRPTTVAELME